jgi:hypothetical protein
MDDDLGAARGITLSVILGLAVLIVLFAVAWTVI